MAEGLPAPFEIRVPTDLVYVRPVRKMLEGLLESQGWNQDPIDDAGSAVTEIVQNSIEHGSRGDGQELVRIIYTLTESGLTIEVEDPGSGKDPRVALEQNVKVMPPLDAERGRGLFMIDQYSVEFDRSLGESGGLRVRVRLETNTE